MSYNLITILGPTAVGKTSLAVKLAYELSGEIISADSRQVYKGMDIGTGKDLEEYFINQKQIPFHLVDVIDPKDEFNLFTFQKMFYEVFSKIKKNKKTPLLCGGTGLYLQSVLKNYDLVPADFSLERKNHLGEKSHEELLALLKELKQGQHNTTDLIDKERTIQAIIIAESERNNIHSSNKPIINSFVIGIREDREKIKKNITARLKHRLRNGMIEEVENLIREGLSFERLDLFGLEYRYIGLYLKGQLNYNDMFQKLNSAIHNFAKRQMTWFRKMEREGIAINWLNGPDFESALNLLSRIEIKN